MTSIIFLKLLHYLSLFLAGGLGVANAMLFKSHQRAEITPAPPVKKTMMALARLGLVSIVILWATGILLTVKVYGHFDLGWPFYLKIFGATTLLAAIAFLNLYLTKQVRAGNSPSLKMMNVITQIARTSLVLVLFGIAVLTTSA